MLKNKTVNNVIGYGCCRDVAFVFSIVFAFLTFNFTYFSCSCRHTLILLLCLLFTCERLSMKWVPADHRNGKYCRDQDLKLRSNFCPALLCCYGNNMSKCNYN